MNVNTFKKQAMKELVKKYTAGMPSFQFGRETFYVDTHGRYMNGGMVVHVLDEKLNIVITLSVNIPEHFDMLCEGEFFAKTWSENENVAAGAMLSGLFKHMGVTIRTGFVDAPIWKCNF